MNKCAFVSICLCGVCVCVFVCVCVCGRVDVYVCPLGFSYLSFPRLHNSASVSACPTLSPAVAGTLKVP